MSRAGFIWPGKTLVPGLETRRDAICGVQQQRNPLSSNKNRPRTSQTNDSKTTSMKPRRLGLILGATALGAFAQSHSIDWFTIEGSTSGLDSVSAPSASHGSLSDLVQPGSWGWGGGWTVGRMGFSSAGQLR